MQKDVIKHEFDALAPVYEHNRLSDWYQAHGDVLLDLVPSLQDGDILDIGCGTGHFLRRYLKRNPSARGLGLDLSDAMIEQARHLADEENLPNAAFIAEDWENVSADNLAGYNFRIIVCANAFHYFADPQAAADRMYQYLADNGRAYTLERDKSRSLLTFLWGFLHHNCIKDHVVFYARDELLHIFSKAGFAGVRVLRSIKRYFWKNKIFTSIVLIECHKNSKVDK